MPDPQQSLRVASAINVFGALVSYERAHDVQAAASGFIVIRDVQ